MASPKEELKKQMDLTAEAYALRDSSDAGEAVALLEAWQKQRLLNTYEDLALEDNNRQATHFFVEELYAPSDLPRRNQDLERMYPMLVRMVPDHMILVVASAVHLQALTLRLDFETAQTLLDLGVDLSTMTVRDYSLAYREMGNRYDREDQIDRIVEVGQGLGRYVHNPMIYTSLKMARPLAAMTGLDRLQQFLEHGFDAFRSMHDPDGFLHVIEERERVILDALMSGDVDRIERWFTQGAMPQSD